LFDISTIFASMKQAMQLSRLEHTVFYALDKAIKLYRQFAQRNIKKSHLDITIDQWLVLKTIKDNPELTQKEIAQKVFKDYASITRIIELLVKRKYLVRSFHNVDRRRYNLELTSSGKKMYEKLIPIVFSNRKIALEGLSEEEITILYRLLQKIMDNCKNHT